MDSNSKTSRRSFLRQLSLIAAGTALTTFPVQELSAKRRKSRKIAPTDKVNLA